ncbi:hypothetical protein NX059_002646 [Plenodomus lindquistii]|nr:hypothetical protein NX059_002646 [Plenodomus lindquistii]
MASTALSPSTYCHFLTSPQIPPELVLKTIHFLPFGDGNLITTLRCAHPRLRKLIKTYERSTTKAFLKKELRHAQTDFPCADEALSLWWLAQCVRKYDIVDDVMDALSSNTQPARLSHVKALSRDPLIAMYLALHHATLSARYHGSGWINQRTYGRFMDANQLSLRNELEFCYAEAALNHGPGFISDMLFHHHTSNAETTLLNTYHDHGTLDWEWPCWGTGKGEFEPPRTQGPQREGKERSLFTTLLETLSERMGCDMGEVRSRVETVTDDKAHSLAYLNLEGKAKLLQGLDVKDGGRLCE